MPVGLRIDEVGDLLLPNPSGASLHERRAELRAALARFERGAQVITRVSNGRVTNVAWLIKGPGKAHFGPTFADRELSETSMLVHDVVSDGNDAGAGERFLDDVMQLARARNPKLELFVALNASDVALAQGVATMGAELEARVSPQTGAIADAEQPTAGDAAVEQQPSS